MGSRALGPQGCRSPPTSLPLPPDPHPLTPTPRWPGQSSPGRMACAPAETPVRVQVPAKPQGRLEALGTRGPVTGGWVGLGMGAARGGVTGSGFLSVCTKPSAPWMRGHSSCPESADTWVQRLQAARRVGAGGCCLPHHCLGAHGGLTGGWARAPAGGPAAAPVLAEDPVSDRGVGRAGGPQPALRAPAEAPASLGTAGGPGLPKGSQDLGPSPGAQTTRGPRVSPPL